MDYTIPDLPKSLRETLCMAQAGLSEMYNQHHITINDYRHHINVLNRLIDECDRHRPLGINGIHANLHTDTCGCEDKGDPSTWAKIERI